MKYITKKSYFRGDKKFGRSTQLIEVSTGKVVFEGLGVSTKKQLIATMQYRDKMQKECKLTLEYCH